MVLVAVARDDFDASGMELVQEGAVAVGSTMAQSLRSKIYHRD